MPESEHNVPTALKSDNEVDELEEEDNFSEDFEGEESEIHDVPLQPPTVQMLTTKTLHSTP